MKKYWMSIIAVVMGLCLSGRAGLIAHYTFDAAGTITSDVSGNGNDLSLYSGAPSYTAEGKYGGATVLNPGDTASDGWKTPAGVITPSFTFAAWLKPMGSVSMVVQPISLVTGYEVYAYNGYRYATMSAEPMSYTISSTAPQVGTWQHVAMTFSPDGGPDVDGIYTGTFTTYIDGELDTTKVGARYAVASNNFQILGRRSSAFFNGLMDDVYFFDNALSQSEVQSLMIPEPASIGLLGISSALVLFVRKRFC